MKNRILILLFIILSLSLAAQTSDEKNLFVGTFTSEGAEGIYLCRFNQTSGAITYQQVFRGIDNPSFIKVSPDRNFLYAAIRPGGDLGKSDGYVYSYRITPEGELVFLNKQLSNGANPCHIDVSPDGNRLAVATYGSGTVSVYEINKDGSLAPASSTVKNKGSGPDSSRQQVPHAHSVLFTADGRQLFSADLGTDRLNIYSLKNDQMVSGNQPFIEITPGAGPRHFTIHPDSKTIYVINELNSTITSVKQTGKNWEIFQTISTVPEGFEGSNYCADIHISADGRFLYGSNRGHNSIAVYSIDPQTKQLNWITSVPTRGEWPRNFTLSKNGKFLLAANQRSGNIVVFKINQDTGIPVFTGNEIKLPAPVCLELQ